MRGAETAGTNEIVDRALRDAEMLGGLLDRQGVAFQAVGSGLNGASFAGPGGQAARSGVAVGESQSGRPAGIVEKWDRCE